MADHFREDLRGSRFEDVQLQGSRFRNVDLSGAVIRGALMIGAEIDGLIDGLRVNGVEIAPLVEAELDRRHPQRAKMRPTDAEGFRAGWAALEQLWAVTVERARRMPPELLHERVDGEWSFIETLRHLVFATDAWVRRAVLGDPAPFDPLGLPHTEMGDLPGVPHDPDARPALDEILAVRADRMRTVREVLAGLTDERLAGQTEPVDAPGYPPPDAYAVRRCLRAILTEEWEHRLFAERDLDVLERRRVGGA
jgi:DinB family protein/pentapeptide repeat protein